MLGSAFRLWAVSSSRPKVRNSPQLPSTHHQLWIEKGNSPALGWVSTTSRGISFPKLWMMSAWSPKGDYELSKARPSTRPSLWAPYNVVVDKSAQRLGQAVRPRPKAGRECSFSESNIPCLTAARAWAYARFLSVAIWRVNVREKTSPCQRSPLDSMGFTLESIRGDLWAWFLLWPRGQRVLGCSL